LSRKYRVTLFEAEDYLGGHTHTHDLAVGGQRLALDTGFIVHNPRHYPLLRRFFGELGVQSQATTMSFSVRHEPSGREYNATSLDTLFCQRRNLFSPRFLGMVRDLLRFYRESPRLLGQPGRGPTLGEYLEEHRYGGAFRDEHLVPMTSALWSASAEQALNFPARYLVQFMMNHQMLKVAERPEWQVVKGGSASYVRALTATWAVRVRESCRVHAVRRLRDHVEVSSEQGVEPYDQVVLACHSDQALGLLADPSAQERAVLGAIAYQLNDTVLHTDTSVLPRNRKAWAAWNAFVADSPAASCTVSYCLNLLQGFKAADTYVVTLNRNAAIDPRKILKRVQYHHPIYSHAAVDAQARKRDIQGHRRTWFAGAYWGWGFHEDGIRSATHVAAALGVDWPQGAERSCAATPVGAAA
jgi:predicted NAD/FAD-binding protein